MIESMMYSAKTLKDTRDNFTTITQSESLILKERVQHLREQMVDLYVTISSIIHDQSLDDEKVLLDNNLKAISTTNLESTELLGQHLHRQNMPGGELSALLHLTSSLNRSHNSLVQAIRELY